MSYLEGKSRNDKRHLDTNKDKGGRKRSYLESNPEGEQAMNIPSAAGPQLALRASVRRTLQGTFLLPGPYHTYSLPQSTLAANE